MKLGKMVWLLVIISCLFTAGVSAAGKGVLSDSGNNKVIDIPIEYPFIKLISNVVYSQVPIRGYDNVALKMDVLAPQQKAPMPAIVYVTGGGFLSANKDSYIQQRMAMAEAGYVVASIEYRVAPTAIFPQPLEDVKAAIRYLKANAAKFNINPDKIGIVGGSAGGYLSAMAGTTSGTRQFDKGENLDQNSEVQAVVDIYGLSDLTRVGSDYSQQVQETHKSAGATEALWVNGSPVFGGRDGGILADTDKAKAANPITYISKNTPPFLLMHGDKDILVSPSQTEILHHALLEQGIQSTRYIVQGAEHGGVYWVQPEVVQVVIDFLDRYLK